jgi:UPF0271 protein
MKRIDLNCDMGELPEAIVGGTQAALMPFLSSVNIACGGHAGSVEMMRATIEQAKCCGVAVGAHPGYADRANFGRVALKISPGAIADSVYEQVRAFGGVRSARGTREATWGALQRGCKGLAGCGRYRYRAVSMAR